MSGFDYENARLDILDSGGDPDFLSYTDPQKRDAYLRKMGLRPEDYGGGSRDLSERLEIRKKRRKFFQRLTGKKETSETA